MSFEFPATILYGEKYAIAFTKEKEFCPKCGALCQKTLKYVTSDYSKETGEKSNYYQVIVKCPNHSSWKFWEEHTSYTKGY